MVQNKKKVLCSYTLEKKKDPLSLTRKIYGYRDCSNRGRYVYERKGILSDIPFEKVSRGSFFIDPEYKEFVLGGFKKLGLKVKVFDLVLAKHS